MIRVENVSKKYKIYKRPAFRLAEWLVWGRKRFHREFWALKNISFSLDSGISLGIIGANGAGKTTLLKILCGISGKTSGKYETQGRVASLLELGIGFHPELTGIENIKMSSRFLGLSEEEIAERIDDMIEFAELGDFINMPIRTYSMGMTIRLGFAVAAGINPDVLIIDEVLSVGDSYFQKKSLNRIEYLVGQGKNIIIVSHSMPIIQRFCDKTLWLNEGKVMAFGDTASVVKQYEAFTVKRENVSFENTVIAGPDGSPEHGNNAAFPDTGVRYGSGEILINRVEMIGENGNDNRLFRTGEKIIVRIHYHAKDLIDNPVFGIMIHSTDGAFLFASTSYNVDPYNFGTIIGASYADYCFEKMILNSGEYDLTVAVFKEPDHPEWNKPSDYHFKMYGFKIWSEKLGHGFVNLNGEWRG